MNKILNPKNTKSLRQKLRKSMSEEEVILWTVLRVKRFGIKIRRQHGIGSYVADFYIPFHKIAIEVDGSQHLDNIEYDKRRDEYFKSEGIETVRFTTKDIRENLSSVINVILKITGK